MISLRFRNPNKEHGFLSNLYASPMLIDGKQWMSVEHYYQAQKVDGLLSFDVDAEREKIRRLPTPILAKKAGRKVGLRGDWDEVKDDIMYRALAVKFTRNPEMNRLLFSTENHLIYFGDKDKYWGVGADGKGLNRLGEMLFELREELMDEVDLQSNSTALVHDGINFPKPDRSDFKPNQYKDDKDLPEIDLGDKTGHLLDGRPYRLEIWALEDMTLITFFFSTIKMIDASPKGILKLLRRELREEEVPRRNWKLNRGDIKVISDASGNSMYSITFLEGLND